MSLRGKKHKLWEKCLAVFLAGLIFPAALPVEVSALGGLPAKSVDAASGPISKENKIRHPSVSSGVTSDERNAQVCQLSYVGGTSSAAPPLSISQSPPSAPWKANYALRAGSAPSARSFVVTEGTLAIIATTSHIEPRGPVRNAAQEVKLLSPAGNSNPIQTGGKLKAVDGLRIVDLNELRQDQLQPFDLSRDIQAVDASVLIRDSLTGKEALVIPYPETGTWVLQVEGIAQSDQVNVQVTVIQNQTSCGACHENCCLVSDVLISLASIFGAYLIPYLICSISLSFPILLVPICLAGIAAVNSPWIIAIEALISYGFDSLAGEIIADKICEWSFQLGLIETCEDILPPFALMQYPEGNEIVSGTFGLEAVVGADRSGVELVEFQYSTDGNNWWPVPGPDSIDGTTVFEGEGGLRFDTIAASIEYEPNVDVRVRARDTLANVSDWDLTDAPFAVDNRGEPSICLEPPAANFGTRPQGDTSSLDVTVMNCGSGTLDWGAALVGSCPWIVSLDEMGASTLRITASTSGLSPGQCDDCLIRVSDINDAGSYADLPVLTCVAPQLGEATLFPSDDAWIDLDCPSCGNHCTDSSIRVQCYASSCGDGDDSDGPLTDLHGYVRFNLSSIPINSIIGSASVFFYVSNVVDSAAIRLAQVRDGSSYSWSECSLSQFLPMTSRDDYVNVSPSKIGTWVEFENQDIRDAVQRWVAGNDLNNGFGIYADNNGEVYFASSESSSRPRLVVSYGPNTPPVCVSPPPRIELDPGLPPYTLDLRNLVEDPETAGSSLTYSVDYPESPTWVTLKSFPEYEVQIAPPIDAGGQIYGAEVTVRDPGGLTSSSPCTFEIYVRPTAPPSITVVEPNGSGDIADGQFEIQWTDADPDSNAEIFLFYDTDSTGFNGVQIVTVPYPLEEDADGTGDSYQWDTTSVPDGQYWIYGIISDGLTENNDYSDGPVLVDHGPPDVAQHWPEDAAVGIGTMGAILVTFSEPMNQGSAETASSLTPGIASCSFSWSGNTLVCEPDVPLEERTLYRFTVSTLAEDLTGQHLAENYSFTFTTGPLPDCVIDEDCNDGNVCTDDSCDPVTGCVYTNNTAPCDDGLFCNGQDTCSGGSCSVNNGDPCPGTECNTCQEDTDSCLDPPGTSCTDDLDVCTDDECDGSGNCMHPYNTVPCEDGEYCTVGEACQSGVCTGGTNRDCSGVADTCNDGVCDEPTAQCLKQAKADGILCEDGDACTAGDTCLGGICQPGAAGICGDGVLQVGCGEQCDDGNLIAGDCCEPDCTLTAQSSTSIVKIIDFSGDGVNNLDGPYGLATDSSENVYVTGHFSDNAFRIQPDGTRMEIIDATGDGAGKTLDYPTGIAADDFGNVYVVGQFTNNAFKIDPGGVITEIIDSSGDGLGNQLTDPVAIAVDGASNAYVVGSNSGNVFKIEPGGTITEIIDSSDGCSNPRRVAADGAGNVYVACANTNNAFKIDTGGTITEIINSAGDGAGNTLNTPYGIAVDPWGNVYVSGAISDNAFKIEPGGTITEIIDSGGDGAGNILDAPTEIAVDVAGNVYLAAEYTNNAFKIDPGGTITEIIDSNGDGLGNLLTNPVPIAGGGAGVAYVGGQSSDNAFRIGPASRVEINEIIDSTGDGVNNLDGPYDLATDSSENVYATGHFSDNAFRIQPDGTRTEIIDATGDGAGKTLDYPTGIAADDFGNVYVVGQFTDNAFKIDPGGVITEIIDSSGDGLGNQLTDPVAIAVDGASNAYVVGSNSGNVFKIEPGGTITEIIDSSDGCSNPRRVAADGPGNVYVACANTNNAFKIEPGGTITEIINSAGDGAGNILESPFGIAVDQWSNVYVSGAISDNAFKIDPGGTITEIIDSTGDGSGNTPDEPNDIAVDLAGNIYLAAQLSHNAFKIEPGGTITEIIDSDGDGLGNLLDHPVPIAGGGAGVAYVGGQSSDNVFRIGPARRVEINEIIDSTGDGMGKSLNGSNGIAAAGNGSVYVDGELSDNVFKIEPNGTITEIIDATGDASGHVLDRPFGLAVDGSSNVYVAGYGSDNAFKIELGGAITQIIDSTGDGAGNTLSRPIDIAVDGASNVYVAGVGSDNALKIEPGGAITQIIDSTGDGTGNTLSAASAIAVDGAGNVYVTGELSHNAFKIEPGGVTTQIIDSTGAGAGKVLSNPTGVAVDGAGNVYVAGEFSDNVFKIEPDGTITEVINSAGDGAGNLLDGPSAIAADAVGNVYVASRISDNAFKVTPGGTVTEIIDAAGDGTGNPLDRLEGIAVDGAGNIYVAGFESDNAFKIDTSAPDSCTDLDSDGAFDYHDNCVSVPNASQFDADGDGFGNACDGDHDQNMICGFSDFNVLLTCFGQSVPGSGPADDIECRESDQDTNGTVGFTDFDLFLGGFGGQPGPSCCVP